MIFYLLFSSKKEKGKVRIYKFLFLFFSIDGMDSIGDIKSDPSMNKFPISSLVHMNHNAGYRIGSTSHIYIFLDFHFKTIF